MGNRVSTCTDKKDYDLISVLTCATKSRSKHSIGACLIGLKTPVIVCSKLVDCRAKFSGQQQLLDKLQSDFSASLDAQLQMTTTRMNPDYAVGRQELLAKIHSLTIEAQTASEQLVRSVLFFERMIT